MGIMESPSFDPGFSTVAMTRVFSAPHRIEAMCRVESALATASADAGLIDPALAAEIAAVCSAPPGDDVALFTEGWEIGSPVLALLERLRGRLSADAAAAIHLGATTQDIVDTTLMLQVVEAGAVLRSQVVRIVERLVSLAVEYRDAPAVARTMLQPARPTTFGLRCAAWLGPFVGALTVLDELPVRAPLQLGGPSGVPFGLGDHARAITVAMADRLGLVASPMPWHTDRQPVIDAVATAQAAARAAAGTATDLVVLAQSEIGEVAMRTGGSSSMPEKRNPFDAVRAITASQVCQTTATVVTAGPPHQLERAAGAWHTELFAVPVVFQTASAAVEAAGLAIESIRPDTDRMAANLGPDPSPTALAMAGDMVDAAVAAARSAVDGDGS